MSPPTSSTLPVTGDLLGEVVMDRFESGAVLRFTLRLRTLAPPLGAVTLASIRFFNVRTWEALEGKVLTDKDVELFDGEAISRAGSGQASFGGEVWLMRVTRLELSGGTPGHLRVHVRGEDTNGARAALELEGEVEAGGIQVRQRDLKTAERLLELDRFEAQPDGDRVRLIPRAAR